ncbi:MAG: hypothetical protein LKF96_02100 [Treponema sp.]|jgi:hypothetical protein|nr:hypothetical protein [Treponema sp.]
MKRFICITTTLILSTLIFYSCTTTGTTAVTPSWINDPAEGLNPDKFTAAVGTGTTRSDAENAAAAAVGKYFKQDIKSKETSQESFSSENEGLATYLSDIEATTSLEDITGIEIQSVWTDSTGTVYARAVIDRQKTGKYYFDKVENNSSEIQTLTSEAEKHTGTFYGCEIMMKAFRKAAENDYYADLASIIYPIYGKMIDLPYGNSAAVGSKLAALQQSVTVMINVDGDNQERIAHAFSSVFTGMGIKTTAGASGGKDDNSPYVLLCTVTMEPADISGSKYSYVRYVVSSNLIETASGGDLLPYSFNGRQGKFSPEEAEQSAYRTIETKIADDYTKKFTELLNSYD